MSDPVIQSKPVPRAFDREPEVGTAAVPMWMMLLPVILLFGGAWYFDWNSGWFNPAVHAPYTSIQQIERMQPVRSDDPTILGKTVYDQVCALCHGVDGGGKPGQAPPFVGSEWVLTDNVGHLIRIPLQGLAGPVTVKGESWNLAMPAMGASLPDDQLAAVLSYMRNAWGNQASFITPAQVGEIRAATKGRSQPWSAVELKEVQ